MTDLLPCPFCGHAAAEQAPHSKFLTVISCGDCGMQGPPHLDLSEAIAAWNRRAPAAPAAGVDLDALDAALAPAHHGRWLAMATTIIDAYPALAAELRASRAEVEALQSFVAQTESAAREHYNEWLLTGCDSKEAIRFVGEIASAAHTALAGQPS